MKPQPLIPSFETIDPNDFSDFYAIMAKNIEDSLTTAGAVPGQDYTRLDLYKLAYPFVLKKWEKGDLQHTTSWVSGDRT
jgi:hypothetical protein